MSLCFLLPLDADANSPSRRPVFSVGFESRHSARRHVPIGVGKVSIQEVAVSVVNRDCNLMTFCVVSIVSARWRVHHIPSPDSDHVSPVWVEDRAVGWGVGSPLYQTRVMGEFADAGEGVLFPLTLMESAIGRDVRAAAGDTLGVDVARSTAGDLNCVARCQGGRVEIVEGILGHALHLIHNHQPAALGMEPFQSRSTHLAS